MLKCQHFHFRFSILFPHKTTTFPVFTFIELRPRILLVGIVGGRGCDDDDDRIAKKSYGRWWNFIILLSRILEKLWHVICHRNPGENSLET